MISIQHSLKLETVIDENSEVGVRLLALPHEQQIELLDQCVNDLLVSRIQPVLEELNKNGSYAIMKVRQ